jgi:rhomboid protease GluP
LAWLWALSLIVAWSSVSYRLGQPIWELQRSQALVAFGAFKGEDLTAAEAWRLIACQWLHVAFPHMLFNAAMIASIGRSLEKQTSAAVMLLIGLAGGAAGQFVSSIADPSAFVTGASQAYLALSGAVMLLARPFRSDWWIAIIGVVVAVGLDLFVSDSGAIKPGHAASFLAGLACAAFILLVRARPNALGA